MSDPIIRRPAGTIPRADDDRYKGGFTFRSMSGKDYTICYDEPNGYWVCSCPGGINYGRCKHLRSYERAPTRWDVKQASETLPPARRPTSTGDRPRPRYPDLPAPFGSGPARSGILRPAPKFEPSPVNAAPLKLPAALTTPVRRFATDEEV